MFKRLFKRKNKRPIYPTDNLSFRDLSGKDIIVTVKENGNGTMLEITDKDHKIKINLDFEKAQLLGGLLICYSDYGILPDLTK